jgi:HEAT repeat protein
MRYFYATPQILILILILLLGLIVEPLGAQTYQSFKEKVAESLYSSDNFLQFAQETVPGFTRQQSTTFYQELLEKETDPFLRQAALDYYRELKDPIAFEILKKQSNASPQDYAVFTAMLHQNPEKTVEFLGELLQNPQYPFPHLVCLFLGKSKKPQAQTLLLQRLQDLKKLQEPELSAPQKALTGFLLEALLSFEDPQLLSFFLPYLSSHPLFVLDALSSSDSSSVASSVASFFSLLSPLMQHASLPVRLRTLECLGKFKNEEALPLILEALKEESWLIRRSALEALSAFSEASLHEVLLQQFSKEERNISILIQAFLAQKKIPIEALLPFLEKATPSTQLRFLKALAQKPLPSPELFPFLFRFLEKYTVIEARYACQALNQPLFLLWLEKNPEKKIKFSQLLATAPPFLCQELLILIKTLKIQEYAPAVLTFLQHPHLELQRLAIQTLGKLGVLSTLNSLLDKIQDPTLSPELSPDLRDALLRVQKHR